MAENNPFAGSEYAEAHGVLRTIIQEQRYEDFYNGLQVNLLGQEVDQSDRRNYYENIVFAVCYGLRNRQEIARR